MRKKCRVKERTLHIPAHSDDQLIFTRGFWNDEGRKEVEMYSMNIIYTTYITSLLLLDDSI